MNTHIIGYLIHRVQNPSREANLVAAYKWLKFFIDLMPDLVVLAPWLPYVEALDEETYRERGLRDGGVLAGLSGIGVGLLCGPEISNGCRGDMANLATYGVTTVDLTPLGRELPPTIGQDKALDSLLALTIRRASLVKQGAWWTIQPSYRLEEQDGPC